MKIQSPFLRRAVGFAGTMFFRSLIGTVDFKWSFYDPEIDPSYGKRHYILMFWHEHILCPLLYRHHASVTMLASPHGDADMVQQAAQFSGMKCVRGSSYSGGTAAVREMLALKEHDVLAFTPDGPRGPARKMAPGAVFLASKLQMPIVLLGIGYDRPWRMNSWDKFAIPKPFSRGRIISSPFITVPKHLTKVDLEHHRQYFETLLNELTQEAESWASSGYHIAGESITCSGPKSSLMYHGYSRKISV